ncbi:MAG: T9SS type B sorting domain-containing protein [Mesonia sp.]|uniref:T9SS type B sorting domain-containing protein n=1 Tax=Mesonia sp. TaxID=1960830 RepID=UPI003241F445
MKICLKILFFLSCYLSFSQNIVVDTETYSAEELINDILVADPTCLDVDVVNVKSGDFDNGKSYGYVTRDTSPFFFEDAIILSTGNALKAAGPNDITNSDDAPGWGGDTDLEEALGMSSGNSTNATSIEFSFTATSSYISFNYIFASDAYLQGNSSSCTSEDGFVALIRHEDSTSYENFAVTPIVPLLYLEELPIMVKNIRPEFEDCAAERELFFNSINSEYHHTNFNGETFSLTAGTNTIPGEKYFIKLAIADDFDYKYDSAVFIEGKSLRNGINFGDNVYALCPEENHQISIPDPNNGIENIDWFYNLDSSSGINTEIPNNNTNELTIEDPGFYKAIVTYNTGCVVEDLIEVQFVSFEEIEDQTLYACDIDGNGIGTFDLNMVRSLFTDYEIYFQVMSFHYTEAEAEAGINEIENIITFQNEFPNQEIYAKMVVSPPMLGASACFSTKKITLSTDSLDIDPIYAVQCYASDQYNLVFPLFELNNQIEESVQLEDLIIEYYSNETNANNNNNPITNFYEVNKSLLPRTIFAKVSKEQGCLGAVEIILDGIEEPDINYDQESPIICVDQGDTAELFSGLLEENDANISYHWNTGENTDNITVTEPGEYTVEITKEIQLGGDTYSCTYTNEIEVIGSESPNIDYRIYGELNNQKIEVFAYGTGNYTYALDDEFGEYQSSNIFPVTIGEHTVYVKDENGCGVISKDFKVVGFLNFFTPNQDGINDIWHLINVERFDNNIEKIYIYDRFGKLLKSIRSHEYWDGTYNGKNMPSTDYWFVISFKNGSQFKSHFTLKR